MEYIYAFTKILLAISIIHVWSINASKESRWRGGDAKNLREEFRVYGISRMGMYVVGFFKIGLSVTLIASLYYTQLTQIASFGLAFFLMGSIYMHIKIKDPWQKSIPAAFFLLLALVIGFTFDTSIVEAFVNH
tara:strand:+ start:1124 stop:1522 length:399 start_codon:yes stop_codon:yes gene_type:complete